MATQPFGRSGLLLVVRYWLSPHSRRAARKRVGVPCGFLGGESALRRGMWAFDEVFIGPAWPSPHSLPSTGSEILQVRIFSFPWALWSSRRFVQAPAGLKSCRGRDAEREPAGGIRGSEKWKGREGALRSARCGAYWRGFRCTETDVRVAGSIWGLATFFGKLLQVVGPDGPRCVRLGLFCVWEPEVLGGYPGPVAALLLDVCLFALVLFFPV